MEDAEARRRERWVACILIVMLGALVPVGIVLALITPQPYGAVGALGLFIFAAVGLAYVVERACCRE